MFYRLCNGSNRVKALPEPKKKEVLRPDQVFQRGKWHIMSRGVVYTEESADGSTLFVHITVDDTVFKERLTHAQKVAADFQEQMERVAEAINVNGTWLKNNYTNLGREYDEDD